MTKLEEAISHIRERRSPLFPDGPSPIGEMFINAMILIESLQDKIDNAKNHD